MADIVIKNLTVRYRNKKEEVLAINDLSADFSCGVNVVLGESGSGKSTLLKAIAGTKEYEGEILYCGEDIESIPINMRDIAMVSQQYLLYPTKTIFDNIAFPLIVKKVPAREVKERVFDIAARLDITVCLTRKPRQISGGQQQRAALARALIKKPTICLLDEPLSNVGGQFKSSARTLIKSILKEYGCTAVYVTHNIYEALSVCDKLFIMEKGKIVTSGTPEQVYNSGVPAVELIKCGLAENVEV